MVKSTYGVAQTCGRLQDGHRPLCGVVRVCDDPVWLSTRLKHKVRTYSAKCPERDIIN